MFLKYSQTYPPFFHFKGDSTAPPTPPLRGLEAFPPPGLVVYQQHWKQRRSPVIPSCCCTSADSEREAGTTRLAPSTSSPQTCHPSRLPLLCPCHCLVLGGLGKSAGALQQEDTMGSWAEAISKRPAAPHSLGIPESAASGALPRYNHDWLSPSL